MRLLTEPMILVVIEWLATIYRINSENCGLDLSWALDKSINPDSRIGTKEVVFPSGTYLTEIWPIFWFSLLILDRIKFIDMHTRLVAKKPPQFAKETGMVRLRNEAKWWGYLCQIRTFFIQNRSPFAVTA